MVSLFVQKAYRNMVAETKANKISLLKACTFKLGDELNNKSFGCLVMYIDTVYHNNAESVICYKLHIKNISTP